MLGRLTCCLFCICNMAQQDIESQQNLWLCLECATDKKTPKTLCTSTSPHMVDSLWHVTLVFIIITEYQSHGNGQYNGYVVKYVFINAEIRGNRSFHVEIVSSCYICKRVIQTVIIVIMKLFGHWHVHITHAQSGVILTTLKLICLHLDCVVV